MLNGFSTKNLLLLVLSITLPSFAFAEESIYESKLVNQSGGEGYRLVKTKAWPTSGCIIDSGKEIVNPGETTILKIKKKTECNESGIGYSMYKLSDKKNEHLLGYLSHRLGDGKFSLQISRFCEGDSCVFSSLNPEQHR